MKANFIWTLAGNVIFAASQWGLLVAFAKLGKPEDVGYYSLGLAITAPVMLFAGLQLRAVQATDARHQAAFADYAGTRVSTTAAGLAFTCAIAVIGYRGALAAAIAAVALSKAVESLSDVIYGLFQRQERMDLISQSLGLRGLLSLASGVIGFVLWRSVWAAVCGVALAWVVVLAAFDLRIAVSLHAGLRRPVLPRFDWQTIVRLLRLSLPLGVVILLVSFNANVPRYLIGGRSVRELGIFSALSYVTLAGTTIVNALGQSAMPRLAAYWLEPDRARFRGLVAKLLGIGLLLGMTAVAVAILAGRPILMLLYGGAYAGNDALFIWLTFAGAASYLTSFAGYSLTATRFFHWQLPLYGLTTLLTLACCAWMVRQDGARGAAKAMAVVGVVQLLATLLILQFALTRRDVRNA